MSDDFRFEYPQTARPSRVGTRSLRGGRRGRAARDWGKWLALCWAGALTAVLLTWRAGEIRGFGWEDPSLRMTVAAILVVILVSFPGYALFRYRKLYQGPRWIELRWKPSGLALLSLVISFASAMWSGYLIAIRVARDLTL